MRFIKKFIFILLLLLIAFFIYRLISPKAANQLLHDIKSFSNEKMGTHFSLTGAQNIVATWAVTDITWSIDEPAIIISSSWWLQEITGDEILLNDTQDSQNTSISETTTWSDVPSSVVSPTPPPPKTTTTTTSQTINQATRDIKALFGQ